MVTEKSVNYVQVPDHHNNFKDSKAEYLFPVPTFELLKDVQVLQSEKVQNIPALIRIDIDGVLLSHQGELSDIYDQTLLTLEGDEDAELEVLPGVYDKLDKWSRMGHKILLVTARKESMRKATEELLEHFAIPYDILIMGMPRGARYVINDKKSDGSNTAYGVNVERDKGLEDVEL